LDKRDQNKRLADRKDEVKSVEGMFAVPRFSFNQMIQSPFFGYSQILTMQNKLQSATPPEEDEVPDDS
jgi:hypothetical protein